MKNLIFRPSLGVALFGLCLSSGAWATTDSLQLISTGSGSVMGGVFTSPYGITVDGTPMLLICDDFTTDISLYQTWNATQNTLTQLSSSTVTADNLKFPAAAYQDPPNTGILGGDGTTSGDNNAAAYDYAVEAVLAAEIAQIPNVGTAQETSQNAILSGELSYAMWSVFDQTLYNNLNTSGNTGFGSLNVDEVKAVDAAIAYAEGLVNAATTGGTPTTSSFTSKWTGQQVTNTIDLGGITNLNSIVVGGETIEGMTIYTPSSTTPSQEFITVSMAEPSYPNTLALDLLAAGGVLLVAFRRRLSRIVR